MFFHHFAVMLKTLMDFIPVKILVTFITDCFLLGVTSTVSCWVLHQLSHVGCYIDCLLLGVTPTVWFWVLHRRSCVGCYINCLMLGVTSTILCWVWHWLSCVGCDTNCVMLGVCIISCLCVADMARGLAGERHCCQDSQLAWGHKTNHPWLHGRIPSSEVLTESAFLFHKRSSGLCYCFLNFSSKQFFSFFCKCSVFSYFLSFPLIVFE